MTDVLISDGGSGDVFASSKMDETGSPRRKLFSIKSLLFFFLAFALGTMFRPDPSQGSEYRELESRSHRVEHVLETTRQELARVKDEKSELEQKVKAHESDVSHVSQLSSEVSALKAERDSCATELSHAKHSLEQATPASVAGPVPQPAPAPAAAVKEPDSSGPARQGSGGSGSGGVYFKNCKAARAQGAAPLYKGEPGYRPKLDEDGDGVACERP